MEIEIAAVITVAEKLETLDKLLERKIMRVALNTAAPAAQLADNVYKYGEYRRIAANLAVMERSIRSELGDEETDIIKRAALGQCGLDYGSKRVKSAIKNVRTMLRGLGVTALTLREYKKLPLYNSECRRLDFIDRQNRHEAKRLRRLAGVSGSAGGIGAVENYKHDNARGYAHCNGENNIAFVG